ncbi:ABC transporter substrate-binding protein [Aquibacillus rhizosphaerae]|uniref:ABC transporter substrate-binding protein n=1 Tax=Aquibacillus rhizosphaerae TaxID=3051431 RepID=A0ABT7L1A1_9BACI|nr:ABC transporter substrate-binding protein [Aquibacillus sp. LR5S19]MDL4839628.1 ABC transporter substrate-binding protein [Aquibacillus sp. LR5S19]
MKNGFSLCLALLLVIFLTACGEEAVGNDKELTEIDVMLDWYPNAVHSFLYVAEDKGYFEDEGLKVNIQFPTNPTDPLNLAASGKITLGFYYQPDVAMARANEDVPVKSVGAIVRSPLNHVVTLDNSPITQPKDLEGRTVGYPGIPLNEALLTTMVANDGGDPNKVNLIDVGFELGSSLVTNKVDAVIGAYVNHEVPVLKHEGHNTRYFNPVDYGVPSYYELVAVTSDNTWNEKQDSIKAFWRAATKGYEIMKENPDEALQILLDNQEEENFPLVKEVEAESIEILLPKMDSEQGFGNQSEKSWQETIDWLEESGLIEDAPVVDDIFVNIVD